MRKKRRKKREGKRERKEKNFGIKSQKKKEKKNLHAHTFSHRYHCAIWPFMSVKFWQCLIVKNNISSFLFKHTIFDQLFAFQRQISNPTPILATFFLKNPRPFVGYQTVNINFIVENQLKYALQISILKIWVNFNLRNDCNKNVKKIAFGNKRTHYVLENGSLGFIGTHHKQ